MGAADESVADGDRAAAQTHDVHGVALHIIIIIVLLHGCQFDVVAAVGAEDGMPEGVAGDGGLDARLRILGGHGVCDGNLLLAAYERAHGVVLLAEVVELVESHLLALQQHRRVVDTVVLGMILHVHLPDGVAVGIGPGTLDVVGVRGDGVRQVDDVARLSVLEQRGVAAGGDLLNLPLHGRQLDHVLSRVDVGCDLHAVGGGMYPCLVVVFLVMRGVGEHLVALLLAAVGDVKDQLRGVVALEHEHHLQVVAQVVPRKRVTQGDGCLIHAAGHTPDERHARVIIEVDAGHVGVEVITDLRRVVVGVVEAVLVEGVSVLHRLDAVRHIRQHAEREAALKVGGDFAAGIAHLHSVNKERGALHRNAGAEVAHESAELHALLHVELHAADAVAARLRAEGDAAQSAVVAGHLGQHVVGTRAAVPVGQAVLLEVAALIGHDLHRERGAADDDGHSGNARAVGEADVARDTSRLHAVSGHPQGALIVRALAAVDAAHAVLIAVCGRGGLVLILHVHELRDQTDGVGRSLHVAPPHLVVVHGHFIDVLPRQQHGALQRLHLQRVAVDVSEVLVVEAVVGQCRCRRAAGHGRGELHLPHQRLAVLPAPVVGCCRGLLALRDTTEPSAKAVKVGAVFDDAPLRFLARATQELLPAIRVEEDFWLEIAVADFGEGLCPAPRHKAGTVRRIKLT